MLTEKECREALEKVRIDNKSYCIDFCSNQGNATEKRKEHSQGLEILEQLITEHFKLQAQYCCVKTTADAMRDVIQHQLPEIEKELKNPPLKFKEIQKGMWIWDNDKKCYLKVLEIDKILGVYFYADSCWQQFEEKRFYRKEIK